MKNSVIIKGNKYGISIVLNDKIEFSKLLEDLIVKLESAEEFFDSNKQLAVTFEGRILSNEELDQILDIIQNNSKLNIQYVMDENSDLEATFFDIIQTEEKQDNIKEEYDLNTNLNPYTETKEQEIAKLKENNITEQENTGMFYKGTLRSGQTLETKDSLIIIGDVNPGATVIAGGNIIIIGALKGSVVAGSKGNHNSFVMALSMNPIQIQIADIIARSSDTKKISKIKKEAMIATIIDNQICIESVSKAAIQDINF